MQFEEPSYVPITRTEYFILLYKIRATYFATYQYYYFFVRIVFGEENLKKQIGGNTYTTTF